MVSPPVSTNEAIENGNGRMCRPSYKNECVELINEPQKSAHTESETVAMNSIAFNNLSDSKSTDNDGSFTNMVIQTGSSIQASSFAATNVPKLPETSADRSAIDALNDGILKLQQEYMASTDKRAFIAELRAICGLNRSKNIVSMADNGKT